MNNRYINTTSHNNPNPNRSRTFTVKFYSQSVDTVVTSTPAVAREWVYSLRSNHSAALYDGDLVIGLGVQWRPTFSSDETPEAATLQLCIGSDCLIFQLSHATAVPATLRKLLVDDRVTFVGVHTGRDRNLLEESEHGVEVGTLVDLARECGPGIWSMEEMAATYLGASNVVKPRWLGLSDWDDFWLSDEQVEYACVDALVSYLLAKPLGFPHDDDDDDDDDEDEDDDSDYDDYYSSCDED